MKPETRGLFVRMFSGAVIDQALLSAGSLAVGLLLIRHASELQYGYFVLVTSILMLMASLQSSFIGPAMIHRMTTLDREGRGRLTGAIYREQRRWSHLLVLVAAVGTVLLWGYGVLDRQTGPLVLVTICTAAAALRREFFRMVLLAYRRSAEVLKADTAYVALLVGGVLATSVMPSPAMATTVLLGLAALVGGTLLKRLLRSREAWDMTGDHGILRRIAPIGAWAVTGAVIHWSYSHGYNYLVAGTLDVAAIAAIAATRLLLMPINLLSTGIGALMLPLTSAWLHTLGAAVVLRRLSLFASGVATVALVYLAVLWLTRDWIFATVLNKQFEHGDTLLVLWSGVFVLMVMRDQLIYLLVARQRFRILAALSAACAVLSLLVSYAGMQRFGVIGAPLGLLVGEALSLTGIVLLSLREIGRPAPLQICAAQASAEDAPVGADRAGFAGE